MLSTPSRTMTFSPGCEPSWSSTFRSASGSIVRGVYQRWRRVGRCRLKPVLPGLRVVFRRSSRGGHLDVAVLRSVLLDESAGFPDPGAADESCGTAVKC